MNLDQIETKCFILALFIRDDDERFLLGTRAFEFIDKQLHFSANTYQNDIVEVQGNDGIMLAGQVRRATVQSFDGFIGDSSVDRSSVEQYRRDFLKFFRKNHYYKVVYIFPDGTAIQRRQGFIVEAPEAKELYQLFPKYHIGMNFEDINYYTYEEDSEGQEIYGESVDIPISGSATGGLIWSNYGAITLNGEGSNFTLTNTVNGNSIYNLQLKGDTSQQTYSGKNLLPPPDDYSTNESGLIITCSNGEYTLSGTPTANSPLTQHTLKESYTIKSGDYLHLNNDFTSWQMQFALVGDIVYAHPSPMPLNNIVSLADYVGETITAIRFHWNANNNFTGTMKPMILNGVSTQTAFEPYVGGTASPNPSYPQTVNTVTGRQVVTISDGGSQSQSYEVNLGKNLLNNSSPTITGSGVTWTPTSTGGTYTAPSTTWGDGVQWRPNLVVGQSYTFQVTIPSALVSNFWTTIHSYTDSTYSTVKTEFLAAEGSSITKTFTPDSPYIRIRIVNRATVSNADITNLQLELGSTATTFAAYFTPIELCKIGTYQDYIYKSGSDWYIHKATGKVVFDGTENWDYGQLAGCYSLLKTALQGLDLPAASINYAVTTFTPTSSTPVEIGKSYAGGGYFNVNYDGTSTTAGLANFKTWLSSNNSFLYGPLATATDTQITNAALIAQLEALDGATTYDDTTMFIVTSENKLGILSLSTEGWAGGGVVWDNVGATWEEGTGGGPTTIDVESIDNVYPIVTITGPATDPQIADLTTNTTLSYTGSITSSQTLKIDMFNKIATLNGVSVLENISGDWLYLKPGANRITYTPSNADAPQATIWWQEIVG